MFRLQVKGQGSGFGSSGLGFRVWGLGSGFGSLGSRFRV